MIYKLYCVRVHNPERDFLQDGLSILVIKNLLNYEYMDNYMTDLTLRAYIHRA